MAMPLADLRIPPPNLDLATPAWDDYLRTFELPAGLLHGADLPMFHVAVAQLDGRDASTATTFDLDGDCSVTNVGTVTWARRRGLGTAITVLALHRARERGCVTASLQSTPMAEGVYSAIGFRDLGRYLEYVPAQR
jgi:ribosomal protein S18 acetylase RimI-like enzyme